MRGGAGEEGPRPGQHCSLNSTSTHRDVLFLTFLLVLILSPSIVQVSDTRMNQDSSRSHQVVRIFVESRPAHWGGAGGRSGRREGGRTGQRIGEETQSLQVGRREEGGIHSLPLPHPFSRGAFRLPLISPCLTLSRCQRGRCRPNPRVVASRLLHHPRPRPPRRTPSAPSPSR